MRANGLNPISLGNIINNLNRLNTSKPLPGLCSTSPNTPTSKDFSSLAIAANGYRNRAPACGTSPIPIHGLLSNSNNSPSVGSTKGKFISPPPGVKKPNWKALIPKTDAKIEERKSFKMDLHYYEDGSCSKSALKESTQANFNSPVKEPFDSTFTDNFTFSPSLHLNDDTNTLHDVNSNLPPIVIDELLISTNHILDILNTKRNSAEDELTNLMGENIVDKNHTGGLWGRVHFRKRILIPPKARSVPPKKAK